MVESLPYLDSNYATGASTTETGQPELTSEAAKSRLVVNENAAKFLSDFYPV